jgi:hypothetical protein
MKYTDSELNFIAEKTGCDCHLCHQPIKFDAYGDYSHPDGWEVDHVRPRSKKGHNGFSNLRAAHTHCNRKKGNRSNRYVRSKFGVKGMPASTSNRIWKGIAYTALGFGTIWLINEICKSRPEPKVTFN